MARRIWQEEVDESWRPFTNASLQKKIDYLERRLAFLEELTQEEYTMAQADVDALTAALTSDVGIFQTAFTGVTNELTALEAQVAAAIAAGVPIDISGLQAQVAAVGAAAQQIASLVPAAVAPPAPDQSATPSS